MLFLGLYIVVARTLLFYLFSAYAIVWRYVSIRDAFLLVKAAAPLTIMMLALRYLAPSAIPILLVPTSVIVVEFLLVILGTSGVRMLRRLTAESEDRQSRGKKSGGLQRNILLIGAGDAGNLVVKELKQRADLATVVAGFVDDDPRKKGMNIQGCASLATLL